MERRDNSAKGSQFPRMREAAARLGTSHPLDPEDLRALLCHDCDFWHDQHEEDLECSCFAMLAELLASGALTPQSLAALLEGPSKRKSRGSP